MVHPEVPHLDAGQILVDVIKACAITCLNFANDHIQSKACISMHILYVIWSNHGLSFIQHPIICVPALQLFFPTLPRTWSMWAPLSGEMIHESFKVSVEVAVAFPWRYAVPDRLSGVTCHLRFISSIWTDHSYTPILMTSKLRQNPGKFRQWGIFLLKTNFLIWK